MKDFLRDYQLIWRYGVQYRHPNLKKSAWPFCLLLLLLGLGFGLREYEGIAAIIFTFGFPVLGAHFWLAYCNGAAALVLPASANLAPHIAQHTRQAIMLTWLLLTITSALLIGPHLGSFWWAFWLVGSVLLMLAPKLLMSPAVSPAMLNVYHASIILPLLLRFAVPSPMLKTDAALMAFLLMLSFSCAYFYQKMLRPVITSAAAKTTSTSSLYAKILRNDCAKSTPQALIMHLFWPICPWNSVTKMAVSAFKPAVFLFLVAGVIIKLVWWPDLGKNTAWGQGIQLILVLTAILMPDDEPYREAMKRSRREQSLFRLTPKAPSAPHFNRLLAQQILRNRFFDWLYASAVFMLASALFGISSNALFVQLAACSVTLPLISASLGNYAQLAEFASNQGMERVKNWLKWLGLLFFAALLVCYLQNLAQFKETELHYSGWWVSGLLVCNLVIAATLIRRRWRRMIAAPIAFPAGRIGI